jgi:hypothetical protein
MKTTAAELSSYKAIVKAIGVYQLVLGSASLYRLVLGEIGFAFTLGPDWQQHVAWAIFEFGTALALLFGTDTFCRFAFRPGEVAQAPSDSSSRP